MKNRRNYYRILQVQPDAPQALITASYRTLMQKLKYHPDLGGDHWNAALVNEAYYVLSNPQRRREYDEALGDKLFNFQRDAAPTPGGGTQGSLRPSAPAGEIACLFCRTSNPDRPDNPFCAECNSPLQPVGLDKIYPELRRAISRVELQDNIQYYTDWPQNPKIAHLCNVSPTGVAMRVAEQLPQDELIKIESMLLSAVGLIVHTEPGPQAGSHTIGVKLLTASFNCRPGTFLKVKI